MRRTLCRSYIILNRQIFQLFNQQKITDTAVLIRSKHAWNHKQHRACAAHSFQEKNKNGVKFQRGRYDGLENRVKLEPTHTFRRGLSKCLLCGVQTNYRLFSFAAHRQKHLPHRQQVLFGVAAVIHQSESGWSCDAGRRTTSLIWGVNSFLKF